MQVARAATAATTRRRRRSLEPEPSAMATPGRRVRPASTLARLPHTLPTTASHAASTGGGQWRSGRAIAVSTFRPASVLRAQVLSTSYSRCWLSTQPDLDTCPHIGSLPPLCPSPHWPLPHGPRCALHRASPTERRNTRGEEPPRPNRRRVGASALKCAPNRPAILHADRRPAARAGRSRRGRRAADADRPAGLRMQPRRRPLLHRRSRPPRRRCIRPAGCSAFSSATTKRL